MIDPATGWFEMCELPTIQIQNKKLIKIKFDKSSSTISRLINRNWLSRYPRLLRVVYDNGSEFKLQF